MIGKLNYLTLTGPNIIFAVGIVSLFMSAPIVRHWVIVEQILCFLKGALGLGISYNNQWNSHSNLERYQMIVGKLNY